MRGLPRNRSSLVYAYGKIGPPAGVEGRRIRGGTVDSMESNSNPSVFRREVSCTETKGHGVENHR